MTKPDLSRKCAPRIFNFVMDRSPSECARELSSVETSELAEMLADQTVERARDVGFKVRGYDLDINDFYFFIPVVQDTQDFLSCIIAHDDIETEGKLKIANHPKTVRSLVSLALRHDSSYYLGRVRPDEQSNNFELSESGAYITTRVPLFPSDLTTCPYAQDGKRDTPTAIFMQTYQWVSACIIHHATKTTGEMAQISD